MTDRELEEDEEMTLEEEVTLKLGDSTEEDKNTSKDDFFQILSNSRRRTVLRYMNIKDDQEVFTTGELAEIVAAYENDIEPSSLKSDQRKRVYVGIYQLHLPDLDEYGAVDYDDDLGRVKRPEGEERHVFNGLVALLDDELYPENQIIGEEFLEEKLTDYREKEDRTYLSQLRQRLPF